MKHVVCERAALAPGRMVVGRAGHIPVVVGCTTTGEVYALVDRCTHQGAELSAGRLTGTTDSKGAPEYEYVREAEIVRCPWHGYEYDLKTGRCLSDASVRVRTLQTTVEDGFVVVES